MLLGFLRDMNNENDAFEVEYKKQYHKRRNVKLDYMLFDWAMRALGRVTLKEKAQLC